MRKSRFTEEQIALALRQLDAGVPVAELCRKLGVSEQTFYSWKRKYAGMGIVEMRRVKQLEDENRRLKGLSRTSPSTSTCSRRSSEKRSKARCAP